MAVHYSRCVSNWTDKHSSNWKIGRMAGPRTNRQILTGGKSYATRQTRRFGAAEVTFDKDSRLDYLTGFHKRKLERQKKAKEFNKEQERQARIEERQKMRDERKEQMEEQMRKFKEGLQLEADIEEEIETARQERISGKKNEEENDSDNESWNGFAGEDDGDENDDGDNSSETKPILKTNKQLTFDDDTTVEVESLEPNENFEYLAKLNNVKLEQSEKILDQSITRATKYAKFLGMADEENDKKKKQKKKGKKFRYLTKNERRDNQRKAYNNKHRRPK